MRRYRRTASGEEAPVWASRARLVTLGEAHGRNAADNHAPAPTRLGNQAFDKAAAEAFAARLPPARRLVCAVCGNATRGRQWWNRDAGFGVCPPCGDWIIARNRADEDAEFLYGVRGVHWDVRA